MRRRPKATPKRLTDVEQELDRLGKGIQLQLESMFDTWQTGLEFKKILSKYAKTAKNMNMSLNEFAHLLEERNWVIVHMTPTGRRMVFSSKCTWTRQEMQEHLHSIDLERQAAKEAKEAMHAKP